MPYRLCPVCRTEGRWLEGPSAGSYVSYFRCDHCGTVWVYDPKNVTEPVRVIMKREPPQ
jgi:hypothetical protein